MIYINEDLCKGCNICVELCPVQTYQKSTKINHKGVCVPEHPDDTKCVKCQLCTLSCPDQALTVEDD
ncbi:MAG: ferredoxin family protein [Methanobacteriaceae archaeon]|nr:ferredoxin family protein [Methanobacteriaceae archaeon]